MVLRKRETQTLIWLYILLALLLLLAYLFFSFVVPQTPGRMSRASVALVQELSLWSFVTSLPLPIPSHTLLIAVLLVIFTLLGFIAYGAAIVISWNRQSRPLLFIVVLSALLFFLISTWSLPNSTTDIYHYILHGRLAAVYDSNPYYVLADEFPEDPLYPYASRKYTSRPGDKLPAWMLMNMLLARLAGDKVITNILFYRSTLLLFNMANVAVIAAILRRLNPRYLLSGVVLYAWNPIVVIYGQSKIDIVMAFYLLLAVLLLISGRKQLTVFMLGLSVLVKLITLPLVAIYMLRNLKLGHWRHFVAGTLLLGGIVILLYTSFWQGSTMLVELIGLLQLGGSSAPQLTSTLLKVGFLFLVVWLGLIQDGSSQKLLWGWALSLLYFSLFLTKLGFAWYLITLIAVVSLVPDWRIVSITVVLSLFALLFNLKYSTFTEEFPAPELFALPGFFVYVAIPLLMAILMIAFLVWQRIRSPSSVRQTSWQAKSEL
jgi:hypothetical protein